MIKLKLKLKEVKTSPRTATGSRRRARRGVEPARAAKESQSAAVVNLWKKLYLTGQKQGLINHDGQFTQPSNMQKAIELFQHWYKLLGIGFERGTPMFKQTFKFEESLNMSAVEQIIREEVKKIFLEQK